MNDTWLLVIFLISWDLVSWGAGKLLKGYKWYTRFSALWDSYYLPIGIALLSFMLVQLLITGDPTDGITLLDLLIVMGYAFIRKLIVDNFRSSTSKNQYR